MTVLERLPLAAQHTLHRVRIGERDVLIATSPTGAAVLMETKKEIDP